MTISLKSRSLLITILLLGLILRLRGFTFHFLLGSDTARDLLVAKGAILTNSLPTVGSFSSAGPFVFGPNWYYFLMLPQMVLPNVFLSPWLLLLAISELLIVVMYLAGKIVGGRKLALTVALLTALSPIAAGYATYLTQHGLVEIFSGLTILGFVAFLKSRRLIYAFLLAAAIGGALSLHYQAINLFIFFPIVVFVDFWRQKNISRLLSLLLVLAGGFLLFLLPLLIWDAFRGFSNTLNLIGYFRVGQYQIYVPNRWLTYVGVFWTTFLGRIFGGTPLLGGFLGVLLLITTVLAFLRRKISPTVFWCFLAFTVQFVVFRYFRGERYEGYVVYFHGLLFLLVAWAFWQLAKMNRPVAFGLFLVMTFYGLRTLIPLQDLNNDVSTLVAITRQIRTTYPGQKVSVYARSLSVTNCAYSLSYVLATAGLADDNGTPIGVCRGNGPSCQVPGEKPITYFNYQHDDCIVVDLSRLAKTELTKDHDWYPFSTIAVKEDVQDWWRKE